MFRAHLADSDHVEVLAATSEASENAYTRKIMPKGKPWPKEQYIRAMK